MGPEFHLQEGKKVLELKAYTTGKGSAIAAFNRTRLMPRLAGDYGRALRLLQSTSLAETALGVAIVAIVAVLGRMTPHALP